MPDARWPHIVALLLAIALGVAGQLWFKQAMSQGAGFVRSLLSPVLIGGLFAYGLSTLCYLFALRRLPLSLAVPSLALGYVLTAVLAVWLLGERLQPVQWAGILLTIIGVVLIHAHPHA